MSHPHDTSIPPASSGQTKTLFCTNGSAEAALVTNTAGKLSSRKRKFPDAHAALAWCITNGANMVFAFAADPAKN
jgi:hypothetical protein